VLYYGSTPVAQVRTDLPVYYLLAGREIYLDLPSGAGRAKLPQALARAHGTPETTRNWRTVLKLLALAGSR